jgi:hypothetical protein
VPPDVYNPRYAGAATIPAAPASVQRSKSSKEPEASCHAAASAVSTHPTIPDLCVPPTLPQAHGRVFYIERERFPHKGLLQALSPPNPMAEALQQAAKLQQEQEQQ